MDEIPHIYLGTNVILDSHGQFLTEGDTVTLVKDIKVTGTAKIIAAGTLLEDIVIQQGEHPIESFVQGIGKVHFKAEFLRKIQE